MLRDSQRALLARTGQLSCAIKENGYVYNYKIIAAVAENSTLRMHFMHQ